MFDPLSMTMAAAGVAAVYYNFRVQLNAVRSQYEQEEFEPETACAIWEEIISEREKHYKEGCNNYGACFMRSQAVAVAPLMDAIYDHYEKTRGFFDLPFDWEFVPAVLPHILSSDGDIVSNPDYDKILQEAFPDE